MKEMKEITENKKRLLPHLKERGCVQPLSLAKLWPSSPQSLSRLSKGQRIDYGEITEVFMAVQKHNDTVMTGNLTTLAEENAEKEVAAVHFYLCVVVCVSMAVNCHTCQRASLRKKEKGKKPAQI